MERLVEGSDLTEEDVDKITARIDRAATKEAMDDLDNGPGA